MRRALKISAWTLGSLLLPLALLLAAVLIAGNTARGRLLIEHMTARLSDGHVRLTGLAGSFPAVIELEQLQLRDAQGVWLTAEHISLHWSPLALLARHVDIESLQLTRLDIERRPVSEPSQKSSSQTSLPRIDLQRLSIGTLALGAELAGTAASFSVQGNMRLISLQDAAAALVAHRSDGPGDYELTLRFDRERMDATLRLEEDAGGPLESLLKYPGLGALAVAASLNGPRGAERVELAARAGELRARASGSLDLVHEAADLAYSLEAPAMTPRPGLSWQRVSLQGRWHGTLNTPQADGRLEIQTLQIPGGAGLDALEATLQADRGALAVHATAAGVVVPGPQPRLLADSPLRLEAEVQLNQAAHPLLLTAEHRLFALQARADTVGMRSATLNLKLPDLAPFAAIAGQTLRGRSQLKATLQRSAAAMRLDLEADTAIASGTTLLSQMLAGPSRLELSGSLTERALQVDRLTLKARALSLSASVTGKRGVTSTAPALQALRARYQLVLPELAVLSPMLAGDLKMNGEASGALDSLTAALQLTANLSVRGSPREPIEATIKARGLPSRVSATLAAHGRFAAAPLELDAALERGAGGGFHLVVQRSQWKSASVEADLTTGANLAPGHGNLRLRVDRLADLQPLLGTSLEGSLAAELALKPAGGRTYIQLRLDAPNVVAGQLAANAHLTAAGPTEALLLQLAVHSANVGGAPASLESTARLDLTARALGLQHAEAHYHGQSLRLLTPAQLNFAEGFEIHQLRLGMQRAVLELDGRVTPALDLNAAVHQVDAALVDSFVPNLLAQGTLDGVARLTGTLAAPSGLVTLKATGLRLNAAPDLAAADVHASAQLMAGTAQLDAHLTAGRSSDVRLTGSAPLTASGALNLKLTGKLDAALANPLLEARGERAAGTLAVALTMTGTARSPEIGGTLQLTHGDLRDYAQGLHLADISAQLIAGQGVLRISSLTARAPPGELSMTGTIGVLQPNIPLALQLTANNAQPLASDLLTVNLGADLKVQGTLRQRLDVSGRIQLNRTVVGIPNALPPDIAVLDVRRPGQAPPPPPEHRLVIGLDISVHAPREVLVQGRGLNAELGGDLHIGGTTASPQVSGGFDLIRGTFSLASTQLFFTKGTVSFNGSGLQHKIDPTLDFTAQSTVADATTTLHVTGLADAPQFELSSSPPLPQDEILARLLFGESASQLTALQLAQIGAALATLSGIGGSGPNPLVKLQKKLGLDRLSVGGASNPTTPGQSTGATVEAGRYVSNRVFVGARQSTTGFTQVEVDVDLSKHLKFETRLGNGTTTTQGTTPENDPGSSVGLMYQFEY